VLLRDERGQEAGVGERLHEGGRIGAVAVERAPILAGKFFAQCPHRRADLREVLGVVAGFGEHHTGSQPNTSPERSSGVNELANAPLSCRSRSSGVQPSERCSERTGRGWLNRKISLRRTAKI